MIDFTLIFMIFLGFLAWCLLISAVIAAFMWRSNKDRQYKIMLDEHNAAKTAQHQNV